MCLQPHISKKNRKNLSCSDRAVENFQKLAVGGKKEEPLHLVPFHIWTESVRKAQTDESD